MKPTAPRMKASPPVTFNKGGSGSMPPSGPATTAGSQPSHPTQPRPIAPTIKGTRDQFIGRSASTSVSQVSGVAQAPAKNAAKAKSTKSTSIWDNIVSAFK